ncbi:MAG: 30S ribosomal protein S21 [Chloroflexi bacterium]|nr:30S ribosomal protein S21 [Chloroflexota bacterium]
MSCTLYAGRLEYGEGGEKRMASVKLKPGESQEQLLRRFRKRVTNAGILSTVRRKRWHISKSELRRIEKKKAIRRSRRRMRRN